ncbi:MAG: bifunctional (p)ppGpp synthetase/guanosine-3',5'-bis(diphosphate) 3'-pyrophosphohydrolase [Deltaproteobacteria bacterium]|jgi:GTP pyrophosphokinase|nr:bifunctional (p)ppGpp synthetase/guanosine-3',5'-bis(diphosphate) 3'-pyrophosphohydrolase [Deltaproteobacteria bacterium]
MGKDASDTSNKDSPKKQGDILDPDATTKGQKPTDDQVSAQTPAEAFNSQIWDLTEPPLNPLDPAVSSSDQDKKPPYSLPKTAVYTFDPSNGYQGLEDIPVYSSEKVRIEDIIDSLLANNPNADEDLVKRAYVTAAVAHQGATRNSGEPYLTHPLAVAAILTDMKLDATTVAVGLLHDTVEDTTLTIEDINKEFGPEVSSMVDGLTKVAKANFTSKTEQKARDLKKLFLSMLRDIRIILVKFADRLHNMRTLGYMSNEKQISISRETLDFFAPLASRLGIHKIQAELEDLSLFYLNPKEFAAIRNSVSMGRENRINYVNKVKNFLSQKLTESNIPCEIEGRPKHIYSIYKKMRDQNLPLEQIYDLVAFRVIVNDVQQCYSTLGVIHTLFTAIPGRFKDYINLPKPNGYQSLHTVVNGLDNIRMEVQIRTKDMHLCAEEGIAAHWHYKEGGQTSTDTRELVNNLKRTLNWQSSEDPVNFLSSIIETFKDDQYIFVYTPMREPQILPLNATVLDFAYEIHTEVGHYCQGAWVNEIRYNIRHTLENCDVVKIDKGSKPNVSADWLNHVVTAKAKYKIRQYLNAKKREDGIKTGKKTIEDTMARLKLSKAKLSQNVLAELGFTDLDDLNYAVGTNKLKVQTVIKAIKPGLEETLTESPKPLPLPVIEQKSNEKLAPMILVDGQENISINFPKCCCPMPGEPITGFLTHGKGVSIHSANCPAVGTLDQSRIVSVSWAHSQALDNEATDIYIKVKLVDEKYLPNIITTMVNHSARMTEFHQSKDYPNQIWFRVPVKNFAHCQELLKALLDLDFQVEKVERFQPPFIPFNSDT